MDATIVTGAGERRSGKIIDHLGGGWLEIECKDGRLVGRDVDSPAVRRQLQEQAR